MFNIAPNFSMDMRANAAKYTLLHIIFQSATFNAIYRK